MSKNVCVSIMIIYNIKLTFCPILYPDLLFSDISVDDNEKPSFSFLNGDTCCCFPKDLKSWNKLVYDVKSTLVYKNNMTLNQSLNIMSCIIYIYIYI